jgi:diaminopimelate decarboxylase
VDTTTLDLEALAAQFRTPFYVYDMDAAASHTRKLRSLLPEFVDLLYCAKANANKVVLGSFKPEVQGLDISSAGELDLAVAVGWSPSVMSFAGPGKNEEELERAIRAGVRIISIESPTELRRASKISRSFGGKPVGITLRINPSSAPKEFPMKMGGLPSQFGVPEEEAEAVMEEALRSEGIHVLGVHVYSGTNSLEPRAIVENAQQTLSIAARLADKFDKTWEVVNLGGGFGVPYFPGQNAMNMEELCKSFSDALTAFRAGSPRFAQTRLLLELGRYLIAEHGAYITRVVDVKETRGKRFAIMDGGMHHCFPATGNFGQVIKKNWPIKNATRPDGELQVQDLVGPLCTPIDSMARAIEIPRAEIDDLVVFDRCGAYSFAASPLLFLSHDTPPELVKKDGNVALVRERRPASYFQ